MHKIVTITFNPCVDKSTTVPSITPEIKMHCTEPKFEPGGGGINVARALKKLGGEALAIYPSGGYSGKFLNSLLRNEGVKTAVIETKIHTRENMIVLETSTNQQYRFGMPGSPVAEADWKKCLLCVEKLDELDFIVASGSLPPGVPIDVYARLARIAKIKNAKFVVDTGGEALKYALQEGVYLAKPNLKELGSFMGNENITIQDLYESGNKILAHGKIHSLVVSLGSQGAVLITAPQLFHVIPPSIDIKSTVGAGDSMVAGIVQSVSNGKSLLEAVQYGVACGTAATLNAGTELCNLRDVEKIITKVRTVFKSSAASV